MHVRLLGPVEARIDGRPVPLGGAKPRALLAILALNAAKPVSADRLIEGLWGADPPATAAKTLQAYVSRLRRALEESGNGTAIVTRARGYELQLEPDDVDAQHFERLVARGAPREALELWHGRALEDVADEPFAAVEIRRLEELRLAAIGDDAQLRRRGDRSGPPRRRDRSRRCPLPTRAPHRPGPAP